MTYGPRLGEADQARVLELYENAVKLALTHLQVAPPPGRKREETGRKT